MAEFTATITSISREYGVYLDVHRGDMCSQLDAYFAFQAHFSQPSGDVELFFGDEFGDIPDPIEDKDQYATLQSLQDDKAFIEALGTGTFRLLADEGDPTGRGFLFEI